MDAQALPGILIADIEHSQFAPSLRPGMNNIPRPDMPTVIAFGRKTRRYTPCRLRVGFFAGTANPSSRRSL